MDNVFKRIEELINGVAEPQDSAEYALVKAYTRGEGGEPLINICIDMKEEMPYYKEAEFEMFILGFAMGQKDYQDKVGGLDLTKFMKDDNDTTH